MATLRISRGDTLSGLAQKQGTSVGELLKLNPNIKDPNLIFAGADLNIPDAAPAPPAAPQPTPTAVQVPQELDVAPLAQKTQPVEVPQLQQQDTSRQFVESLQVPQVQAQEAFQQQQPTFEQIQQQAGQFTEPLEAQRAGLFGRIEESLGKLTGRGTRQRELEAQAGIPESQQRLGQLNTQIAQLTGEFQKAITAAEGQPIPTPIIAGQQAQLRRQGAAEIGALTSVAQALQGNIALAQQTAQRAVDLEFEPIEQEIQNTRLLLDINKERLSGAEKRRAEQLGFELQERQNSIEEQKQEKSAILDFAAEAAQAGADNAMVRNILKSKSVADALAIGSSFLEPSSQFDKPLSLEDAAKFGVPVGTTMRDLLGEVPTEQLAAKDLLDLQLKQANLQKIQRETELLNSGLDETTIKQVDALAKQFDTHPIVKEFIETQNKKFSVDDMLESGETSGPVDLALVFEFMKALDPTSVVRESEFDSAAKSGSIFKGAFTKFNGQFTDGDFLPEEVKSEFQRLVGIKFESKLSQYENLQGEFTRRINAKTDRGDGKDFLTEYNFERITGDLGEAPTLQGSFRSVDDLVATQPEFEFFVEGLREDGVTDEEAMFIIQQRFSDFSEELSSSLKDSAAKTGAFSSTIGQGTITAFGSPVWKPGLDFVLTGGKGASVPAPISGEIIEVVGNFSNPRSTPLSMAQGKKQNKGFGNQVKIRTADGAEIWISHLDDTADLRPGQRIAKGQPIGTQGNTGVTLGKTGVHLDITAKDPKGNLLTARQVATFLS